MRGNRSDSGYGGVRKRRQAEAGRQAGRADKVMPGNERKGFFVFT